jgi:hypothetical protein
LFATSEHPGSGREQAAEKSGLMSNGKWQMETQPGFAIFHLRFAIQDAFLAS